MADAGKPCPFCGNKRTHFQIDASADGVGRYMRLECSACGCGTRQVHFYEDDPELRQELRERWAKRPTLELWRPIATAPKDGTTVIVGRDMGDFGFVRGHARFEGRDGAFASGWISHGFSEHLGNLGLAHPTHWMPLPAAPAAQGSA